MPAQKVRWQKARLREAEFIRLHTDGLTYEQIGDLYGITKQAVSVAINRGLQRVRYEAVGEWRQSVLARLEGQYDLLVPAMERGDVRAHEAGVRILGEIAKVVGAYAPAQTENKNIDEVRVVFADGDTPAPDGAASGDPA